ncbi:MULTISPECIES: MFS transporter [unclassified Pseudoclavibacter]|uniref:MFS transporter n=1 Tax=unclassified Pseudoclavibacter TaxID=2615177 RepID=UPI0012F13862|nr:MULTISPECIES: MFS transporter [unclassified Pseudoclavibacter]MBF4460127.1 MHS family MFS transporter [Pseudoclavibacter sp. VKM Ac-2867]VXC01683.1 Shikimate transporter [Pseudoclavibacter sp. 8L]
MTTKSITVTTTDARRIAVAAFAGTALEWYDYFLFGTAAAIVFNRLYFTTLDPVAALLAAFATFGVGFVARPIGAVLFGAIGDRIGRKPALILTVVLIGVATGLIGFLPDYAAIGVLAPIALAVLRLLQGLAVGGEWGGAVTMAVEHAPIEQRGRFAALPQLGSPVGTLLSSGAIALVLLMPPESFDAWGWRLPFLAAFPLLLIALWMRNRMEESPVFLELAKRAESMPKVPALVVFRRSPGRLLAGIGASLLGVAGFYIMTTFVVGYGTTTLGLPREWLVNATLIAAVVQIGALLICGRLTERFGAGRMSVVGGIVTAVVAFPVFWLIDTGEFLLIALAITIGTASIDIVYAAAGTLLSELFPPEQRYSGVSLSFNIAGAIGGFLPLIATALLGVTGGGSWIAALLLVLVAVLTALGGYFGGRLRIVDNVVAADRANA